MNPEVGIIHFDSTDLVSCLIPNSGIPNGTHLLVYLYLCTSCCFFCCCCCLLVLLTAVFHAFSTVDNQWSCLCFACVASPLFLLFFLVCVTAWLFLLSTCDPPCRLPVSSPPLQEEEVVAPLGHPKLQGVFQQNFLRVQPHSCLPAGRDRGKPSAVSVFTGWVSKVSSACPPARERPDRSYMGGFSGLSMIILRSRQLQASDFLASRLLPHARSAAAVHIVKIVSLRG